MGQLKLMVGRIMAKEKTIPVWGRFILCSINLLALLRFHFSHHKMAELSEAAPSVPSVPSVSTEPQARDVIYCGGKYQFSHIKSASPNLPQSLPFLNQLPIVYTVSS